MKPIFHTFDTFICVHSSEVDYLLEFAVQSWRQNFRPKAKLHLITNDRTPVEEFVDRVGLREVASVSTDGDWLSTQEMELPGWYKQQLVKLRAYKICQTENFCNLGADTVLLQPIGADDLLSDGYPITYYTGRPKKVLDRHYRYEMFRCLSVARVLRTVPFRTLRYVDFITDLFTFNRDDLIALDERMHRIHGPDCYYKLLKDYGKVVQNQKKFGEWTLYTTFVLDVLVRQPVVRDMSQGFLRQIYSQAALDNYDFDSTVVHLVSKNLKQDMVRQRLTDRLALSARRAAQSHEEVGV